MLLVTALIVPSLVRHDVIQFIFLHLVIVSRSCLVHTYGCRPSSSTIATKVELPAVCSCEGEVL